MQAVAGALLPDVLLELVVHERDVSLEVKDEAEGEVRRLLGVDARRVGDHDAALRGGGVVDVVDAGPVARDEPQVGKAPNDVSGEVVVSHDHRVGVIGKVDDLGLGEDAAVGVDPHLAPRRLEPLECLVREHAERCCTGCYLEWLGGVAHGSVLSM